MATTNQAAIRALANPIRRRIVELLRDGELPVNALVAQFDVARPAISRHLKVLREAGLVTYRSEHKTRLYALDPGEMDRLRREFDAEFRDFWRPQGSGDGTGGPDEVELQSWRSHEIAVSVELPTPSELAFRYVTEEALFKQWVGEDARSDPVVGGKASATSAFGGRLVAEYLAIEPGQFLALRVVEPLAADANLYTITFEALGDQLTRVTLRHFVRDENVARLVAMAWSETWKLLRNFALREAGAG